ncbi:GNAT family N-acetyltransferase [Sutterella sp.]|uniref:GNAT family N-acetyltransferase n=1 Tax=Sutterella sp. TaxID=1981025 RepID=UPI0026DF386A|nr:GNAT family N-acetyltransferase [Sutterella sp.]MDO5532920.1 GNAT family N-acetyltransferase [Sutterella sp.]
MHFRLASPSDAPALLNIYAEYIDTAITFEYTLPSVEEFAGRLLNMSSFYPYIVAEDDEGNPLGYAYAHRHMERAAYQWNVELSIYLKRSAIGQGLGLRLYNALMDILKLMGIRSVFGCVTSPNPPSDSLHAKLGFDKVGEYRLSGWKNGQWHTVTWYQKHLCDMTDEPKPPVSVHALPKEAVAGVLEKYAA